MSLMSRKSTYKSGDILVSHRTENEHQDLADARLYLVTDVKMDVWRYHQAKCKFFATLC